MLIGLNRLSFRQAQDAFGPGRGFGRGMGGRMMLGRGFGNVCYYYYNIFLLGDGF